MPGGKRRLKHLFTTGIEVSQDGNGADFTEILAGSTTVTAPSFAAGSTAGSTEDVNVAIAQLTAAHYFLATPGSAMPANAVFLRANAGAGSAVFTFMHTGSAAVAETAVVFDYMGFTLR